MALEFLKNIDPRIWTSIINVGGGLLEGLGEGRARREDTAADRAADREFQQRMAIANYLAGRDDDDRGAALTQLGALGGPFGIADNLQKQRMRRELLGNVRNISISAPDDIESSRGRISGGLRVPEGGFDVRALSEGSLGESVRSYLDTLAQINPNGTTLDVGTMGLDGVTGRVEDARRGYRDRADARQAEIMRYLTGATTGVAPSGMPTGPDGTFTTPAENGRTLDSGNDQMRETPWWREFMQRQGYRLQGEPIRLNDRQRKELQRIAEANGVRFVRGMEIDPAGNINQDNGFDAIAGRVGRVAARVAPLAANFIPGVGPIAGALISAGAGAADAKLSGGSWGDAAKNAGMSGATSYGMSRLGNPFRIRRTPSVAAPSQADLIRQGLLGRSVGDGLI